MIPQDLHIHTVYSIADSAVTAEQTMSLIARFRHAEIIGISDHFECLIGPAFNRYATEAAVHGFFLGCEVSGFEWAGKAADHPLDYYIYHCRDDDRAYEGLRILCATGRPVIVAHPMMMGTDLNRVPRECLIEINNRYVWRNDFEAFYTPFIEAFRFMFSSDAHQPHWLNQHIARKVGRILGVREQILFPVPV